MAITRPKPKQHDPSLSRPSIAGPESGPVSPFPVYLEGWVTRGFGRGSKDLGCPTANLPDSSIAPYSTTLPTGVYYGFARVLDAPSSLSSSSAEGSGSVSADEGSKTLFKGTENERVKPMVMSVGWNPFYGNDKRTAEVHILHQYPSDFYGKELRVVILGWIREELNYEGMDALIKDINHDILIARNSVARPAYQAYVEDHFFERASALERPESDPAKKRERPEEEKGKEEGKL